MKVVIKAIVAVDQNWGIGYRNDMPWGPKPLDGKRFATLTRGGIVIMGRKTFDSINRKPLRDRYNIVMTRTLAFNSTDECFTKELQYARTIDEALNIALQRVFEYKNNTIWIIGGFEVYRAFWPFIREIELTRVEHTFDVDTYFPNLDQPSETWIGLWKGEVVARQPSDLHVPYDLTFYHYERV